MCRSKMAVDATEPRLTTPTRRSSRSQSQLSNSPSSSVPSTSNNNNRSNDNNRITGSGSGSVYGSSYRLDTSADTATASFSTASLSSLRKSLPENPHIYDFSEIRSATNNFLSKRFSSSSAPSWRCSLRGKGVIVFQRKFRRLIQTSELRDKLAVICRSHHSSIIKLLGASISGDHIYLVYEFMKGSNLSECLRNARNSNFTVLSTWMSRIQIATDLAAGLDYIHNNAGFDLVHKYVKSSSVIVIEPSLNAKICHFGAAELCGETAAEAKVDTHAPPPEMRRLDSRAMKFEGVKGYMSPEFRGRATQESDVYAFGVVLLELLSGEEAVRYKFNKATGEYTKISLVEDAREAVRGGGLAVEGRLRRWVDRRLRDSFPVAVAEKLTRVGLECVDEDPNRRPKMGRVAGKISKLYLESKIWSDKFSIPEGISVSLAPR